MIRLIRSQVLIALSILLCAIGAANAGAGDLFSITGSGTVTTLDIQLCLSVSGTTPWNCENHIVTRQTLSIQTVRPNHTYPAAGIKILTSGYTLSGCTFVSNGYCQFSVSNTTAASVIVTSLAAPTLASITPNTGTASGGTGFSVTGTNLTGATGITFAGTVATSVNVVNSTTVTGVTPAHAAGAVDVVITTPEGTATLMNGYTYETTAVGQSSGGGVIACLNGGLNNLIAATVDNPSSPIQWGGSGINVPIASSTTDGATNTANIVACLTNGQGGAQCAGSIININTYAAGICSSYQVDSQNQNPCQAGNTCYNDWFLPAGNNTNPSGQLNCLYTNKDAIGGFGNNLYWSSTELDANFAWDQDLLNAGQLFGNKDFNYQVRCVRGFTP